MLLTLLIITGSGRMCLNSLWYHLVPSPVVILFEQHRFPSTSPEQICWRSSPDLERILRDLSRLFAMFGLLEQLQHDDPPVVSVASASRRVVYGARPRCELMSLVLSTDGIISTSKARQGNPSDTFHLVLDYTYG
jgi:hypothetical protein